MVADGAHSHQHPMADQLYLSYWIDRFDAGNMLRHYEKILRLFPYSRLSQQPSVFKVIPLAYREPAVFERAYPPPLDIDEVLAAAKDFQNADSCYRLETRWDLWQADPEWKLAPAPAALCCFGPEFERDLGEDLRVEFGIETLFLPQSDRDGELKMTQSNIKSLLKLVHDLDDALRVERRQLWSESGENFAEKLQKALEG
jgi:hypothetical protein